MTLTLMYQQELKKIRRAVTQALEQAYRQLPDFSQASTDLFLAKAVPLAVAGQRRAVDLTNAVMARTIGISPVGLDYATLIGAALRNGVDPNSVYARPLITARASIKDLGFAGAFNKGLARLSDTANMDVAMAARNASHSFANVASDGEQVVIGLIRRADPGCCKFCTTVDGAKCFVENPAPLHNNCSCTLEPLMGTRRPPKDAEGWLTLTPGSVIGDTIIQEHGEMGPLLMDKNNSFTSVSELPAAYLQEVSH